MKKILTFIPVLAALGFAACQSDGVLTEHGYRFINHTNKGGQKVQIGDMVLVQSYMYVKDSLIASSQRTFGGPREYQMVPKEQLPGGRVPLMSEGDSATIFEPIEPADQKNLPPHMQGAREVRHELVLVKLTTLADKENALAEANAAMVAVQNRVQAVVKDYAAGKLAGKLTVKPSGLKMLIEDQGSGKPIQANEKVDVHYYGCLVSGSMFDNSYKRGRPYPITAGVGQMIEGFDEGIMALNRGGKAYLFIPPKLGYGSEGYGPVPGNAELIFYIEVN